MGRWPDDKRRGEGELWPSDALPLWIVAGIVLCFVLHFGQRRLQAAEAPVVAAKPLQSVDALKHLDPEICNRSKEAKLYTTVAYYDPIRRDWIARGWYPVAQGACSRPLKNLLPPVFVYAESKDGANRFGGEKDDASFCIDGEAGFILPQKDCTPGKSGQRRVSFRELKPRAGEASLKWEPGR